MILEIAVVFLGLGMLLLDLWTPVESKRKLGYAAVIAVGLIFLWSFRVTPEASHQQMYVLDSLALFFKRFFLLSALAVLLMAIEFADRIEAGICEYYALILFALAGMMLAASANDFTLLFVDPSDSLPRYCHGHRA